MSEESDSLARFHDDHSPRTPAETERRSTRLSLYLLDGAREEDERRTYMGSVGGTRYLRMACNRVLLSASRMAAGGTTQLAAGEARGTHSMYRYLMCH